MVDVWENHTDECLNCEAESWSDPVFIGPCVGRDSGPEDDETTYILRMCRGCGATQIKTAFGPDEWDIGYWGRDRAGEKRRAEQIQAKSPD